MGITVVLQNHAPVTAPGYEDALAMVQEIDRRNVKLCLDAPLFYERQDGAYVREAVERCRDYVVYSHYGAWNFSEAADGRIVQGPAPSFGGQINYPAFIDALRHIGYTGYLSSEYCVAVVKHHQIAGVEEVDTANRIALRYMKQLVEGAAAPSRDRLVTASA
jgi:sugar phosphate isomerase/epimerase